jgi:hypothetical protein
MLVETGFKTVIMQRFAGGSAPYIPASIHSGDSMIDTPLVEQRSLQALIKLGRT